MLSPIASAFAFCWIALQVHFCIAASCTQPDWEWSRNSLGQDPCAVVQILEAKCQNLASFDLQPLKTGTNYLTPQEGKATGCDCNTVIYSLYQACSQCQIPQSGDTWTFYDEHCTAVYVTEIPLAIPKNTEVPPWAYLNVTLENNFNATAARALAAKQNYPGTPASPTTSLNLTDPTPTGANHTGEIVGGVVGGIAIISLSIALIFLILIRKKAGKVKLARSLPQAEEYLLPLDSYSPPTITRGLPKNATYRELSGSGVMTAYDSSFYPRNTVVPSQNGYNGFAEV